MDAVQALWDAAHTHAQALSGPPRSVAFVATSYDTDFEPLADQVEGKIRQFEAMYGVDGPVRWSLWVVDDLPEAAGFTARIVDGYARRPLLRRAGRLQVLPMSGARRRPGGLKGRAVLDGFGAALAAGADAVCYLNLNLKVDAGLSAAGLRGVLEDRLDVAVGSRAARDGGVVVGAGSLGRVKSRLFSAIARTALPPLARYVDTNAPMKIFSARAARHLRAQARIDHVTLDCEWLLIAEQAGLRVARFPIAWVQRPGSSPPWHLVALSVRDVFRIRGGWRRDAYGRMRLRGPAP